MNESLCSTPGTLKIATSPLSPVKDNVISAVRRRRAVPCTIIECTLPTPALHITNQIYQNVYTCFDALGWEQSLLNSFIFILRLLPIRPSDDRYFINTNHLLTLMF